MSSLFWDFKGKANVSMLYLQLSQLFQIPHKLSKLIGLIIVHPDYSKETDPMATFKCTASTPTLVKPVKPIISKDTEG